MVVGTSGLGKMCGDGGEMDTTGSRSQNSPEVSPHGDSIQGQDSSPLQRGEGIFIRTKSEVYSVGNVFIFLNMSYSSPKSKTGKRGRVRSQWLN